MDEHFLTLRCLTSLQVVSPNRGRPWAWRTDSFFETSCVRSEGLLYQNQLPTLTPKAVQTACCMRKEVQIKNSEVQRKKRPHGQWTRSISEISKRWRWGQILGDDNSLSRGTDGGKDGPFSGKGQRSPSPRCRRHGREQGSVRPGRGP